MPTTRSTWSNSWSYGYGRTGRSSNTRRTNRTNTTSSRTGSSTTYSSSKFTNTRREIQQRITSYRTLNEQVSGASSVTAFSPSAANKWVRFVDNGANVFKFNNNEFSRFFGTQTSRGNATVAFRTLRRKYGAGIKAVTRGRNNTWLVAASTNVTARPFSTYNWK
ncbi:MAG: hypothetical protein U1D55_18145 [Phycisphaerae bacterium]